MKHSSDASGGVSRETLARLETYAALLLQWNRTINLISRKDEAVLWERHIVDSLALLPVLPQDFSHAIDLGSGGGLPGIVLAICTGKPFHLVESDQRKCAFLREAARALDASTAARLSASPGRAGGSASPERRRAAEEEGPAEEPRAPAVPPP